MSSIIKQLSDPDLDVIRHMIRRDASSDLAIAKEVEKRLKKSLGKTDGARIMIVSRFRKSAEFQAWLRRWENQDVDLKKQIALQRDRLQVLSDLVKDSDGNGIANISKHLQARMLTIAAEASDEQLASGDIKWVKDILRVVQDQGKIERDLAVENLKHELESMANAPKGKRIEAADLVAKVDEIMGINHA